MGIWLYRLSPTRKESQRRGSATKWWCREKKQLLRKVSVERETAEVDVGFLNAKTKSKTRNVKRQGPTSFYHHLAPRYLLLGPKELKVSSLKDLPSSRKKRSQILAFFFFLTVLTVTGLPSCSNVNLSKAPNELWCALYCFLLKYELAAKYNEIFEASLPRETDVQQKKCYSRGIGHNLESRREH